MAVAVWCGGLFPLAEVFLGSSTVWIEGGRAARLGIDLMKHCIFTTPRPQDCPIGPPVGTTTGGVPNVLIGGVPMPSLTGMALGAAFKGMFKGVGALGRVLRKKSGGPPQLANAASKPVTGGSRQVHPPRVRIPTQLQSRLKQRIDELIKDGTIAFSKKATPAFINAARRDLQYMLASPGFRRNIARIQALGRKVTIAPPNGKFKGANAAAMDGGAYVRLADDPSGSFRLHGLSPEEAALWQKRYPGIPVESRVSIDGPGSGSDTLITYDPLNATRYGSDRIGSPSDSTLNHEFGHALSNAEGKNQAMLTRASDNFGFEDMWVQSWRNMEEANVVTKVDNPYRKSWGLPERRDYTSPLPTTQLHSKTPTLHGDDWLLE